MDLWAQYRGLYAAALFTVECAEDAYRLGALDPVLRAWVRRELENREGSIGHCDSRMDVAAAVEGLATVAPRYVKLRRELFSDLHHIGRPAPQWRAVGTRLAVLAPLQVWRQPPAYALLLRDPGTATAGAQSWDFIVFPRSGDPREPGTTYTTMLFADPAPAPASGVDSSRRPGTVQVTPQLEEQREHYEQLTHAFHALDRDVRFAALHDPDAGRGDPLPPPG
ncbi:hypothetical protein [Embleya sp. AB8]|uniref:hypothetical protein n=1 Tax=Embleya sp. AB8 TaxID=3156304 RepID=UPI003C79108F